jgi:hypothetical protein
MLAELSKLEGVHAERRRKKSIGTSGYLSDA